MTKIDFKKELKHLYKPSAKKVVAVDVPTLNYLMVTGKGEPGGTAYTQALETLYPVAYTLKFMAKSGDLGTDYVVMPLEGLWWSDNMDDYITRNKSNWQWTMMIMQPELITATMVDEAIAQVRKKKNPAALELLRFEAFTEGKVAQTLHIGPFENEGPTIERIHQFIEDSGAQLAGKHHEIYLSDIRRAAPEKWRTVLRQPMRQEGHSGEGTPFLKAQCSYRAKLRKTSGMFLCVRTIQMVVNTSNAPRITQANGTAGTAKSSAIEKALNQ